MTRSSQGGVRMSYPSSVSPARDALGTVFVHLTSVQICTLD